MVARPHARPHLYWRRREERLSVLVCLLDDHITRALARAEALADDDPRITHEFVRAGMLDARLDAAIAACTLAGERVWS